MSPQDPRCVLKTPNGGLKGCRPCCNIDFWYISPLKRLFSAQRGLVDMGKK